MCYGYGMVWVWVEGQNIVWVDDEREPNRRNLEVSSSLRDGVRSDDGPFTAGLRDLSETERYNFECF